MSRRRRGFAALVAVVAAGVAGMAPVAQAAPGATEISPTSGPAGTVISITNTDVCTELALGDLTDATGALLDDAFGPPGTPLELTVPSTARPGLYLVGLVCSEYAEDVEYALARFVVTGQTPLPPSVPAETSGEMNVSPAQGSTDTPITLSGAGFLAGSTVTFGIYSTPQVLGTATATATGTVSLQTKLPAGLAAGQHTILAIGVDDTGTQRVLVAGVTVSATGVVTGTTVAGTQVTATTASAGGSSLPRTGSAPMLLVLAAGLALAVGVPLARATRRRFAHLMPIPLSRTEQWLAERGVRPR